MSLKSGWIENPKNTLSLLSSENFQETFKLSILFMNNNKYYIEVGVFKRVKNSKIQNESEIPNKEIQTTQMETYRHLQRYKMKKR